MYCEDQPTFCRRPLMMDTLAEDPESTAGIEGATVHAFLLVEHWVHESYGTVLMHTLQSQGIAFGKRVKKNAASESLCDMLG